MISTANPESMTAVERRAEVAQILAQGLIRCIRTAKTADPVNAQNSSKISQKALELPSKSRLSVAQRPSS